MTEEERATAETGTRAALAISVLVALTLFIALPQGLAAGLGKLIGAEWGVQDPRFHLVTGAFKMLVLLGYLIAISRIPDVRRVFQYHGAEHKTIYAYERGLALTLENVRTQSTLHPRCGTTFLIVVIAVSIVVGSVVTPLVLPGVTGWTGQLMTLALRIGLLPIIASISYELQRLSARFCTRGPLQVLLWPGYLFQKITTREPDDTQLEVAIASMEVALLRQPDSLTVLSSEPLVFGSFQALQTALPSLKVEPALANAA
jgi:uncharacterized protein YqhQ